jgi:hypothetical protein
VERELQDAARIRGRDLAKCWGSYGENRLIRILELSVIEYVEGIHAQFHVVLFTDAEML